jgi:hypothetical protein
MSQENDTPRLRHAATWQSLYREFTQLATEENKMPRVGSQYVTLLSVYWTCDEPAHIPEKDRRRALEKDACLSAHSHVNDPEMIRADETDLGFFCLFKSRDTSEAFWERFQTLAVKAGRAIGACKDTDYVYVWLYHVFNSLIENRSTREISSALAGQESPENPGPFAKAILSILEVAYPWERFLIWQKGTRTGFLLRVCEASAIVCNRLEKQALEAEQSKQNIGGQAQPGALNIRLERGKRCREFVGEMRRFRYLRLDCGMTVEEVQKENPTFLIWKVRESLSADDQHLFDHPNRWESPVSYAYGLLAKKYGRSSMTIRDWVKVWNRSQRPGPTPLTRAT